MSTIRATSGPPDRPPPGSDPFFYGWRDVVIKDEKGRRVVRQPLTREDVLHPREGDVMPQNRDHDADCAYLHDVLGTQLHGEPTTLVGHDLLILWDVPGLGNHSPDLVVIPDVPLPHPRDSFDVAAAGVRPQLIIEVTSPSTHDVDLNDKRREYWLAGVPVYVIVEEQLRRGRRQLRILPYQRGPRAYRKQRLTRGRFWLEAAELWLGQENGRVALYNAQGQRMLSYREQHNALGQADQRVAAAAQEATQAKQEAIQAKQRATEAEHQATQAKQRATQAEEQVAQANQRTARLAELSRKARRGQASPQELLELESLEETLPPP
jgi:Uma2 family endonuclease